MENDLNKNSDKIEKKEWEIPTIEILNFKQTHGGDLYDITDNVSYSIT